MKHYKLSIILIGILFFTSCSDWLDVKPKSTVNEEDIFSRELGFKEALTGTYILMSDTVLYGRNLSYGITDYLAQRYEPGGATDRQLEFTDPDWYKFPTKKNEYYVNVLWKKLYNSIANVNNLLSWLEKNRDVITTPDYYEIIKGEALGIRAFLYFDLLRLYGPVYNDENKSSLTLPYRTEFNREDKTFHTAEQVIGFIEKDILAAEELLEVDPMYIEFPKGSSDETRNLDDFLRYRFKRMNRYAVKALAARMYLWKGDKTNAMNYAKQVIDAKDEDGNNYFTLVADNSNDRIFSTEIIFSVSVNKLDKQVDEDFIMSGPNTNYFLYDKNKLDQIFDCSVDGYNDIRYREGQGFTFSSLSAVSLKYNQKSSYSFAIDNTMPLIRLPEMYYIMAECVTDKAQSEYYLSYVRAARAISDIEYKNNDEDRLYNIMKEYRKEFYAEGQLWYFYKRHKYKTFLNCPIDNMTESNYRFSIPESEQEFGSIK